jgi:monoamine oxidase
MSYISFNSPSSSSLKESASSSTGSLRSAFSRWLLTNHGASYRTEVKRQRARPNAKHFSELISSSSRSNSTGEPLVGIVGGGFAGLYAGLILQSLGIECEIFESSDRVGGRIYTWYSSDYSEKSGLYGEVGGMRVPQFSADMLPVQQLALAVNAVLERNGLADKMVYWRKFYYDSPVQRLRYNNMPSFITKAEADLNSFNFDFENGGDIPQVWFEEKTDVDGSKYLPINMVLEMVNTPFIDAINNSFAEGFALMMQYDQHSMWDYLTNVFTLGDLQQYYDPAMGAKSDFLPWPVASFLETTNVGTGMYSVSFVEMVIAVYDWGGSKNPYDPSDQSIYMVTVDEGMQHFPDACRTVLDLDRGISEKDGQLAQIQVGMAKDKNNKFSYTAPNLTPDARPPGAAATAEEYHSLTSDTAGVSKQRVFLEHKVIQMEHEPGLYNDHGGMKLRIKNQSDSQVIEKQYPYVISTLPTGAYLNGELKDNLLNNLSFAKAQAIRESNYMPAFKAFLTFKKQFWAELGERQDKGLGAASTDRPNRQIIYPSYGYEAAEGVLQVYCWAQDAERLGALADEERINECLKGIDYLYPDGNVYENFAGYSDGKTTKTWFWDSHSGGGAFALFAPEQYKNIYPILLTPEFDGCLNFAGESCSVHHGWIVGALDSAYNAVYHILQQAGATEKLQQMQATWGAFAPPDVAPGKTANEMDYVYEYNSIDRQAASIAPGATASIYGDSQFEFKGNLPAFVADFEKVPQAMKKTIEDNNVLNLLNDQWNDNVAQREIVRTNSAKAAADSCLSETAVEILEKIYYGDNFQTIPKPLFWLKDDDEFARQQLAGFMPNLLTKVSLDDVSSIVKNAGITNVADLILEEVAYVADYRKYLEACTVTPTGYYLAKPIVFFKVTNENELLPIGIQLEPSGELFTPAMPNAENAWLLAKMQTNGAGQTLHDVGFHQLYAHQICAMVSIALYSEEVFNPETSPISGMPFQEHPVFKLLRPHVVKTVEFQQSIYNRDYNPYAQSFPETRIVNGKPGVYNLGFVYDLIFSCGRIGNYQLQDKMYHDEGKFRFLDLAIPRDAKKRGVQNTPFSYAYVHDASLWYEAIAQFVEEFIDNIYSGGDAAVADDIQLQRFFDKLIPAFNHIEGSHEQAQRFPDQVTTTARLKEVLTMFVWQFSVQHTVVNDGAYNHAAFVPNASTLMLPLPADKTSKEWTAAAVLACLPSQTATYPELGNMNFMDIQINASVTGQGPYPETILGRGVLEPSLDFLQDTYGFTDPNLRQAVNNFYQQARAVDDAIRQRQGKDIARYFALHPESQNVPETVLFNLLAPVNVMNTIQT